ncbi:MAG: 3-methyl-2-oxobutanoate hydroxymethyltransferase [Prevotellaceae bacterium]|nr:3-methyl-2-oxobutanoate hydroxymethyltransferase [Prevotellaceae bacterium]MDY3856303.1 3-methyl-2-oxobutanoate hydroxymethyltransferase [Bacteroidaceae bacterium]
MSKYIVEDTKKITSTRFTAMKAEGKKIAMLTSYDYALARIVDQAGVDSILIGDSASNVMAGNANTLPITLDEMIFYARSVARAVKRAFVICDMPFGTFQVSPNETVRNAIRIVKETGVDAVKLEGGAEIQAHIRAILCAGIPVCGHLGLTPQSINKFGSYGVRAKERAEADKLIEDAKLLDEIGCCGVVLEKIPAQLAAKVAKATRIPMIGIGAGHEVDGQVLVVNDMLGMDPSFKPKFVRHYAHLSETIADAVGQYVSDVKECHFPSLEEQY